MARRVFLLLTLILLLALSLLVPSKPAMAQDDDASIAEMAAEATDDEGFLTRVLQSRLSGTGRTVKIEGFNGALSSRATFDRIVISDPEGTWLTLEDGAIQWTRSALLRGRVEIGELSAARISIPRGPHSGAEETERSTAAGSFNLPELPVGINIEKIEAEEVILGADLIGEDATFNVTGSMSLAGGEGKADLVVNRIDGKKGDFVFKGSFDNDSRVLDIDLTLDEDANGIFSNALKIEDRPAVYAEIKGAGPLSDYQGTVRIDTDGQPRINGAISFNAEENADGVAGNRFDLRIGGDVAALLPPRTESSLAAIPSLPRRAGARIRGV